MVGLMQRHFYLVASLSVSGALLISGAAAAQADSADAQVMRAIAERITSEHPESPPTIVGIAERCNPREAWLCDGNAYSRTGLAKVLRSAQLLGIALNKVVSPNPTEAAREYVLPPVVADSSKPRALWYRRCEPGPYVLTIRPSGIVETQPGTEWRVYVQVNVDPVRGECIGGGTGHYYVVTRDSSTRAFRVTGKTFVGSGQGHIR